MVLHKRWHGADLNSVGIVGWILEQTVVGIEQLLGQQEEELSGGAAVVQSEQRNTDTPFLTQLNR